MPAAAIAVVVDLYMLDGLFNGMLNPIYIIAAGGLLNIAPVRTWPQVQTTTGPTDSQEGLVVRYRSLGRSLKNQGRLAEAKTAWLHALELSAEQPTVRSAVLARRQQWCDCANDLAWFLVNAPDPVVQDPALAISLALKAAELHPECSTYWNTLGAVHYRAGDFKAAVTALNRATALTQGEQPSTTSFWPWLTCDLKIKNKLSTRSRRRCSGWNSIRPDMLNCVVFAMRPDPSSSQSLRPPTPLIDARGSVLETAHRDHLVPCDGSDD